MKMTSKERVFHAFAHEEPDRVPITEFVYSRKLYKEVLGYAPPYYRGEEVLRCAKAMEYDLAVIPFGGFGGFSAENSSNKYQDEWGTLYQHEETTWPVDAPVGFSIATPEDLRNFTRPDPKLPQRLKEIKDGIRLAREYDMAIAGSLRGPLSAGWLMTGFENFCTSLYDEPEFIHEILALCADFFIEGGKRLIAEGVDAIVIADDYGSCVSPFFSMDHFREFIFPELARMAETFSNLGVPVILHSDGHIKPLLPDIAKMKITGLHPLERAAGHDLGEIKAAYGKRFTMIGNVDNKTTLVSGSTDDVRAEVRECIDAAALGGGYILASDHSVHDDIPNANVFALADEGHKYGDYQQIRDRAARKG